MEIVKTNVSLLLDLSRELNTDLYLLYRQRFSLTELGINYFFIGGKLFKRRGLNGFTLVEYSPSDLPIIPFWREKLVKKPFQPLVI